jgi:hypothetical protein
VIFISPTCKRNLHIQTSLNISCSLAILSGWGRKVVPYIWNGVQLIAILCLVSRTVQLIVILSLVSRTVELIVILSHVSRTSQLIVILSLLSRTQYSW